MSAPEGRGAGPMGAPDDGAGLLHARGSAGGGSLRGDGGRAVGPGWLGRWGRDLGLGVRLAMSGGRDGWARSVLTALGVALGVALMLAAASIPTIVTAHHDRQSARAITYPYPPLARGDDTALVARADTTFHDLRIHGEIVQAEGDRPPLPPGVDALPDPGQMLVSPALARLLAQPDSALLRQRLDHPVVGTIGPDGLTGPAEYAYYLGSDRLDDAYPVPGSPVTRIDHFGRQRPSAPFPALLVLLVVVGVVVLLAPVAVFIAAAVRFGGDNRDRRLAAIRLVGANAAMIDRIAAGEALVAAVLGVLAGGLAFLVVRPLAARITLWNVSVFAGDMRPSLPMALLIAVGVPAAAVAVAMATMRRVVVEPLGVFRRAPRNRRRLWWRLVLPLVALALLLPLAGEVSDAGPGPNRWRVSAGILLLLFGMTLLMPWLIETAVRRLGGGPVGWQLAVRRLQLDVTASSRQVNGVAVAAAGGIALLTLLSVVDARQPAMASISAPPPDVAPIQVTRTAVPAGGPTAADLAGRIRAATGVRDVDPYVSMNVDWTSPGGRSGSGTLIVGDCAVVRAMTTAGRCADGDVFSVNRAVGDGGPRGAPPGSRIVLGTSPSDPVLTVPADARAVSMDHPDLVNVAPFGVFATPGALDVRAIAGRAIHVRVWPDTSVPDYRERIVTAAVRADPLARVSSREASPRPTRFVQIRRGLLAGTGLVLVLIGASLLVGIAEQLRERRKLLAVLVAYGTQRRTLGASVFWQAAVPVVLGLTLAAGTGIGLGCLLLRMVREPLRVAWDQVGLVCGAGAVVVLGVTVLSLPLLWRFTRPDGLHTE